MISAFGIEHGFNINKVDQTSPIKQLKIRPLEERKAYRRGALRESVLIPGSLITGGLLGAGAAKYKKNPKLGLALGSAGLATNIAVMNHANYKGNKAVERYRNENIK